MPSSRSEVRRSIRADLHRRRAGWTGLLSNPALRYLAVYRVASHLRGSGGPVVIGLRFWLMRARWRYGFDLALDAEIGPGLYLPGHPGGVVVNPAAIIGANCNLSHDVTIGQINRGPRKGVPRIGDRVWIGPGARVLGNVTVGDGAVIGPNAVVTEDVEPNAVMAAPRTQKISDAGSAGYVNQISE